MYLQEIIIDGFKSYAQKTVVSGFDSQFNAITGLNGTGKSNILDAICFVLGINNLTQVRVGNLQELVYKQGQAGVTKATVTIIFNNSDPATSPVGYESHKQITVTRQVVIGGKNKYMVNGHTVQQSQVQNLFHSVQLNVNNPHFLIMQGRITKVLNMKPHETLGMIEEAAGTRMFETKKQASLKTIEKKQLKVDEITKCINEEITPTLENLRHERQDYHAWQSNNTEYERLERFCIACDYQTAETRVKSSEADKENMLAQLEALNKDSEEQSKLAEQCVGQITEIARRRDEQMEGEMQEIKRTEAELSKEVVKINTLFTNHQESISGEESTLAKLAKQLISVEKSINDKNQALNQKTIEVNEKEQMMKDADANYMKMRETYHNACAGVADENTAELLSIPEQIVAWEKCERETSSKLQQCQQKQSHVNKTLTDLQKSNKSQSNTHNNMMKDMEKANKSIASKKAQYESISISPEQVVTTKRIVQELQNTVSSLRDEVSGLEIGVNTRLQFDYQDPEPRFDRNRVKGCVARLFGISEARFATALEIVAGNKLTQVVVDNENTGKLLLQRGQLKKRVTILPLNKLAAKKVSEEKLSKAREIASSMKGSADLALNLISFNEDVRRAMEYVFGSVVICSSPQIAKTIAFDKSLRLRTVTMEGDSFDPSGTLTGGSNNQLGTLLKKVNDYRIAEAAYKSKSTELIQKEKELQTLDQQLLLKNQLGNELELAQQQLQSLQDALNETDYAQLMKQIEECQQELVTIQTEEKQLKELQSKASNELKTLGKAEKNAAKAREQKLKEFENQVKAAQKLAGSIKTEWMTLKTQKETLQAELKSLENEFKTIKEQQQVSQSALVRLQADGQQMEQKLTKLRKEYDIAKEKVNQKSQELNLISQEIQELEKIKENHLKASQEATLEGRKLMHKIKQWDKEFKETTKVIQNLLKQHPWIEKEKQYFGQNGTDFDFSSKDIQQCYARLKVLKSEQERLSKKINKKVMGMIENAESEYEDLTRKRQVILNDKSKIESVIQELDVKKQQALQKTWSQVNKDFGSIFSMLLPGTTAKLEPPEGSDVSEGLEVKVAFNGVWKESLTELSGGQRSLLALSLILALLLFKPAPMYILDEVDAALDLSHTQNIGMMIKTHFSASQFIVVSLKEGMFNNANVIFRTRFVDGVSAVTRTVAGSRGKAANALALKDIEDEDFSSSTKADGSNEDDDIENLPKKKKGKTVSGSKKTSSDMKAPVAIDAL